MGPPVSLASLFWIFFRIACTSFGGFMAMISVVENVVVERRKLLTHADMLDGISLASMLPGPVAVNVCAYVGYRLRGGHGAFIAAAAAILPPFLLIVALSAAYFQWGQIPAVAKVFQGFIPAVTAIIVAAAWNMMRKSVAGAREGLLMAGAAAALIGIGGFYSTLAIIFVAGVIGWAWFREPVAAPEPAADAPTDKPAPRLDTNQFVMSAAPLAAPFASLDPVLLAKLGGIFAGMSVMLFGGGYVFIPLIQHILDDGQGWVTQQEFIDAIAMGQITPGPILVSAAFIGYKVAGLAGALVATVGIFTPPAVLMVAAARVLERIKRSAAIRAALRGVRPAVVGMIFAAAAVVGRGAEPVWVSVAIFMVALYALLRFRVDAVWIIPAAGALGLIAY